MAQKDDDSTLERKDWCFERKRSCVRVKFWINRDQNSNIFSYFLWGFEIVGWQCYIQSDF